MKKECMMIIRHNPKGHKSDAVSFGDTVFISGLAGRDLSLGLEAQVADILVQLDALLEKCGSSKQHMLMATIWMASPADAAILNRVWNDWLGHGAQPARACVGAVLQKSDMLVEIAVVAAPKTAQRVAP